MNNDTFCFNGVNNDNNYEIDINNYLNENENYEIKIKLIKEIIENNNDTKKNNILLSMINDYEKMIEKNTKYIETQLK